MMDLVERLRRLGEPNNLMRGRLYQGCREAADEIERLRSQQEDRSGWVTIEQYTREIEENEKLRSQLVFAETELAELRLLVGKLNGGEELQMLMKINNRLLDQIKDAEVGLSTWDENHDSEYWLRWPSTNTDD